MENRNVIRFEFTKKGALKYISHLDLHRALARIIKRSHIPIRYTQGFNPHPKMVFALPLSVGCESECELLDVYMEMDEKRPNFPLYTPEQFKEAIIDNLPKGLEYVNAYYPTASFSQIESAVYEVTVDLTQEDKIESHISRILSSPMTVLKKSKSGDKYIDILPLLKDFKINQNGNSLILKLRLSAAQNEYLNPETVMSVLKSDSLIGEKIDYYTIMRKSIVFS